MQSSMKASFCCLRRIDLLLLAVCLSLSGCRTFVRKEKPLVEITRSPSADPGGPARLDYIEGRARGGGPGAQVVLYTHSSDIWWVQPFANQVFTRIQPDSTWRNWTHLGIEYAALLVEPGYHPALKLAALPGTGNGVDAITIVKGTGKPIVPKTIHFSGFDWTVRAAGNDRGGEANLYDPDNAWVDRNGYLHLRMQERNGHWTCVEISLNRSLGYGSYRFVVQDTGHLPPSAVLGMYTLNELQPTDVRNELDIEISRWGLASSLNAQYVVQPFYIPENVSRFRVPSGTLTHSLRWELGKASFKTVRGSGLTSGAGAVSEHIFTSGVPTTANEKVHMDLYDYRHSRQKSEEPVEVVIEKFEFLP
jgi:hypothetical protein